MSRPTIIAALCVLTTLLLAACGGGGAGGGAASAPVCGNGKVEGTEACDDGNRVETDGCLSSCTLLDTCAGVEISGTSPAVVCGGAPTVVLTGANFYRAGAALPAVSLDGAPVPVTGAGGCMPVSGAVGLDRCTTLDVDVSSVAHASGSHTFAVVGLGTPACTPASITVPFGVAPGVLFADPPILFAGAELDAVVHVTGLSAPPVSVGLRDSTGAHTSVTASWSAAYPEEVRVTIPSTLTADAYQLEVDPGTGCPGTLPAGLRLAGNPNVPIASVTPSSLEAGSATRLAVLVTNPPGPGLASLLPGARAWLLPQSGSAIALNSGVQDAGTMDVGVPPTVAAGTYGLLVGNPDGGFGLVATAVRVVPALPRVSSVIPAYLVSGSPSTFNVRGAAFAVDATATVHCQLPDASIQPASAAFSRTDATLATVVVFAPAAGSRCVLQIVNGDGGVGEFGPVPVVSPSLGIASFYGAPSLGVARRAPAVASAEVGGRRYLYALGGDSGAESGALASGEVSTLDRYGRLGPWRSLPASIGGARTLAAATGIGRYVYLAGGNGGSGALATAQAAAALDPADAPASLEARMATVGAGIGAGIWTYAVSAVMAATDAANPGGETLPSAPVAVAVPSLPTAQAVTLQWAPVPSAVGYRVYRTPTPGAFSGAMRLLATVDASASSFVDAGAATGTGAPRQPGDLGSWIPLPALGSARDGLGLAAGLDPGDATKWHLYAVAGRSGTVVLSSVERLAVTAIGRTQTAATTWVATHALANGRQLAGVTAVTAAESVALGGGPWVYAAGGTDATATTALTSGEAAQVVTGGDLTWVTLPRQVPARAGFAFWGSAEIMHFAGGQNVSPSTTVSAAQICNGGACGSPPALGNANLAASLGTARFLAGSANVNGWAHVVGGMGTSGALTSVESSSY